MPEVSLELHTAKAEQLVWEPYDLRLVLVNHGTRPVAIARAFYAYDAISLLTDNGEVTCKVVEPGVKGAAKVEWQLIQPRSEVTLGLPAFNCLCNESSGCEDWLQKAGRYMLKVTFSHHPTDVGIVPPLAKPEGAIDGAFESNLVEVRVKTPTGLDAEALAWAKANNESPLSVKVVTRFPSSRYAAIVAYSKMSLEGTDPSKVKALIDQGLFPSWNSVPDPSSPDGWRALYREDLALWVVKEGEAILRNHPDFPYVRQVRLAVGVNALRVGMKEKGLLVLRELAKNPDTPEGSWAIGFLALLK